MQPPTVDVRAPDGGRIVLQPVVRLDRLPGLSRDALAAVLVLCAIFLATSVNRLNHTDLWGHLNFGRWMVEHRAWPQADPFRPWASDAGFLNVPWLSQVLGYLCHAGVGLDGLVLAHAALATLSAALLMLAVRDRGASLGWGAAAAAAAYVLSVPILGTIRPQLFGTAGMAATLWAVSRLPARRDPLVWLGPLYVLWANLHGSFAMGLLALACHAAGVSWEGFRPSGEEKGAGPGPRGFRRLAVLWTDPPVRRAWLALAIATGACCVNPLGASLFPAVAGFAGEGNLEGISEWRPMTIDSLSGALFLVSVLITGVLLRFSPRRVWPAEILMLLVFGLGALGAIRMLAWWALVWPWVAAPHAAAAWLLYRRTGPLDAEDRAACPPAAWRTLLAAACVLTVVWWAPPTHAVLAGKARAESAALSRDTPEGLADQLVARGIAGRIYAPMDWADYLIWRTGGAVEPLVYSHVHLIGPEAWRDFLAMDSGSDEWLPIADRYGLEHLVVSAARNPQLAAAAARHPRCRVVFKDRQGAVLRIAPP